MDLAEDKDRGDRGNAHGDGWQMGVLEVPRDVDEGLEDELMLADLDAE